MGDVIPFRRIEPVCPTPMDELDTYLLEHINMTFETMLNMLGCFDNSIKVTVELGEGSLLTTQDIRNKLSHDVIDSPE